MGSDDPRPKRGRTKIDKDAATVKLLALLRDAHPVRAACKAAGCNWTTVGVWKKSDKAFAAEYKKAMAEGRETKRQVCEQAILTAATKENGPWQAAAWWLERNYPNRYALRNRTEISGPRGGPIKLSPPTLEDRLGRRLTGEEIDALRAEAEGEMQELLRRRGLAE